MVATSEKPLRIAVPYRVSFVEFVTVLEDNHTVKGYCIDVFEAALKLVPYYVPHEFVPFGDGHSSPSYWNLVNMVADQVTTHHFPFLFQMYTLGIVLSVCFSLELLRCL